MPGPGDSGGDNTVLRAVDSIRFSFQEHLVGAPVAGTPVTKASADIVAWCLATTFPTAALFALCGMNPDDDRVICRKSYIIYRSVLDI